MCVFPFTFFASEDVSLVLVIVGAILGWILSKGHRKLLLGLLLTLVGTGLLMWAVLLATGIFRPSQSPWDEVHGWAGHLMLPAVAWAIGLWFGDSVVSISQRPLGFAVRLLALFFLAFCCFSNARTGYLGSPNLDTPDGLRFHILHRIACPSYAGIVLTVWVLRLRIHIVEMSQIQSPETVASPKGEDR
jgi:hypothetical protein